MAGLLFRVMTALALAFTFHASASAQRQPQNIATRLITESDTPAPGRKVTLALAMTPKPGWHGYWQNPGDAGVEMKAEWLLPTGVTAGAFRYPVPQRLLLSGLMNYVYEGPYALLVDLDVPQGLAAGTKLPVRASLDYLACTREMCVPERADVALDLVVGDGTVAPERATAFDVYRQKLPKPLGGVAHYAVEGGRFRLGVPLPGDVALADPYFFPASGNAIAYSAPQTISRNGDMLVIEGAAAGPPSTGTVSGIVQIGEGLGLAVEAVAGTVPPTGEPLGTAEHDAPDGAALPLALLGAFAGGLLLNIMPCVFPILSLKALSLAKAGETEGAARREAVAYTAGAVAICLSLGAVILALRASGGAAGWAFQLQDPRVILLLLFLVTAIALNLAGLFELPSIVAGERLTRAGGGTGAFWTGALAAFIATPCTGPFMAAALGAALVLPAPAALAVFGGLGLGLAFPFLLLGFVPAFRRRLPRPGPWMVTFRKLLSLPMFATALGLVWILGRQTGVDGMATGIGAALAIGLGLWWSANRRRRGYAILALLPAVIAATAAILYVPVDAAPAKAKSEGVLGAEPFSEARLAALRAEGRPVFIYFTADWCLTCKANEKTALDRDEVANAFAARNVAVMVGDWTRGDPEIGRFLARHGRSGVPLYLYYAPGKEPEILPQLLTVGRLTRLVS